MSASGPGTRVGDGAGTQADRAAEPAWPDALYEVLRAHDVTQVAYVPDAGHARVIARAVADPDVHAVSLTTEEEGVGLLAGADLGGARGVLLVQSSGVGNCVNLLSLVTNGRFPFLMIVSMRGEVGEVNPWQCPMGQATETVLGAMGVVVARVTEPHEVAPTVDAALTTVHRGGPPIAVLLSQQLIGIKAFAAPEATG